MLCLVEEHFVLHLFTRKLQSNQFKPVILIFHQVLGFLDRNDKLTVLQAFFTERNISDLDNSAQLVEKCHQWLM